MYIFGQHKMNVGYGDPKLKVKMLQRVKKVSESALCHTDEKLIIEIFINIKFNKPKTDIYFEIEPTISKLYINWFPLKIYLITVEYMPLKYYVPTL